MAPTVSVIMSVYNGDRYLSEAIASILHQTFTHFELIIINDASTDETATVLAAYADRDSRIRLIQNEQNIGLTKSLNKGLNLASGRYIARQDSDDISYPERFAQQVALLDAHPDVVVASCNLELINEHGETIGYHRRACSPNLVAWYLLFYNHLAGHSQVMFRRELACQLGGYDENRRYSQDYELWSRFINHGKIVISPEIFLKYRKHTNSIGTARRSQQLELSLSQARHNIESLIQQSLGVDEPEQLRKFMMLPESSEHIDTVLALNLRRLHSRLQVIYASFVAIDRVRDRRGSPEIRRAIASKFIVLLNHIGWSGNVLTKLTLSWYVLQWSPRLMVENWNITVSKKLSKKLRLL